MSSFYITTAIDYVNGKPHLGHAYEKIGTDVIARWRRLMGDEVFYLTGTDEHGSKVEKTAAAAGMEPKEFVDSLIPAFQDAWKALDISYDRFIRTTDPDHRVAAIALLERIRDNGYLTEKVYEGWYCDGCEAFKTDKDLEDGKCPDHPTLAPRWIEETNLFFTLSAFEERLLAHYDAHPEFVTPAFRRNEVLSLIRSGLLDLSISRSRESVGWGIDIPFREDSVIYVWFEALINYLTGAGFGSDEATFARRWPGAVHILGKDVTRFHCVLWPAMLMAAGVPLPDRIFAHGWVLTGGAKMSKSSGVGVEPLAMAERYGADPIRFYLVTQVPWGKDGEFTWERFETTYTAFLANGIGNLLSRSISMAIKYFGGVPEGAPETGLRDLCAEVVAEATDAYDALRITEGANAAWRIVRECNEQIQARAPWAMAKDPDQREALASFLYGLLESLRIAAALLSPVMPGKCAQLQDALGCADDRGRHGPAVLAWGGMRPGAELSKPAPLFPRLDQLLAD